MIRRFQPGDLKQILHIEDHAFPKSSYTAEMLRRCHRIFPETFLVFEEQMVLGYIIFNSDGHVISIAVDPFHRREGIGKHLMDVCESQCRADRLLVEVREGNTGAQEFYRNLGFQVTAKVRFYYDEEDAYVMEKKIRAKG